MRHSLLNLDYSTLDPMDLRDLLDNGADVNEIDSDGNTPLMNVLIACNQLSLVKILLAAHADVSIVNLKGEDAYKIAEKFKRSPLILKEIEKYQKSVECIPDLDLPKFDKAICVTSEGVIFFKDYVSKKGEDFNTCSQEDLEFRESIYKFKEHKNVRDFAFYVPYASMYVKGLVDLINQFGFDKVALVATPRSSENKISPVRICISLIEKWCQTGKIKKVYRISPKIYNLGKLLKRKKDILEAHSSGERLICEEHIQTISCEKIPEQAKESIFVLMDDIVTKGDTLNACEKILVSQGIKQNQIFKLTLGSTKFRGN